MSKTYRVVQWSTGHVGKHAIAGIDARPDVELVGLWVSNPDKVGKDAGELAGLGRNLGVAATNDAEALLALKPDCIVHTAWADDRIVEALGDLARFLRAGINVVSSSPVFLQYPYGVADDMAADVIAAAHEGGASIFVNGVDPGFGNDVLPLVMTGVCERIDEVRCIELLNYATYDQASVLSDIMGFGLPMDVTPFILLPGVLTMAWGSVVYQIGKALDVTFDKVEESYQRYPAPEDFDIPTGTISEGTQAALRFEVRGMVGGKAVLVVEHVTRIHPDIAHDWPEPPEGAAGAHRVVVEGRPRIEVTVEAEDEGGNRAAGGNATAAARLVDAIPFLVAAEPGLYDALQVPLRYGRGRLRA